MIAIEMGMERPAGLMETVLLNPDQKGLRAEGFEQELSNRIVGQQEAVRRLSDLYQIFLAGMNSSERPIGTMLFLGPTGSGKTRVVEAAAEVLFGDSHAVTKIDCAEFQHSHEIAKLIGSPPGYLGHRETSPLLTQDSLDRFQAEDVKISLVLFDEIEKASDSLWQLLLGILDKATLTLGDNRRVDFSRTIVVMTSNLGAREMSELIGGGIGFAPAQDSTQGPGIDEKMGRTAVDAARRKFSPEFMNRIDAVVAFRSLSPDHLRQILDLELQNLQHRIMVSAETKFEFQCSRAAKELILTEGIDARYGARHLKRAIERLLVSPLSNLLATDQVEPGGLINVEVEPETGQLMFLKQAASSPISATASSNMEPITLNHLSMGFGVMVPQASKSYVSTLNGSVHR
jgi:ATP-dependent Clp protease ATP-binding subunit ClpB